MKVELSKKTVIDVIQYASAKPVLFKGKEMTTDSITDEELEGVLDFMEKYGKVKFEDYLKFILKNID